MSIDREQQELILLRILGVLLILVGFAMLARYAQSGSSWAEPTASRHTHEGRETCRHAHVELRSLTPPPLPPPIGR